MKKKYAKTKLIIITILVIIGLCLTLVKFSIPGTSTDFLGFVGAIKSSTELGDSYKVVMTVDRSGGEVKNSDINDAVEVVYDIFTTYVSDYSDVKVTRATKGSDEQIVAYIPNKSLNESFFELFESAKKIEGKTAGGATVITNKNIKTAQYTIDGDEHYGVYIKFDNEGTGNLIKYGDDLVFTLDGESATYQITNNMLFIYNSNISSSQSSASTMPVSLLVGKIDFGMSVETYTINALAGSNVKVILIVATIVMAVGYVVYMILRHKSMGLVSLLSGAIFVIADTFVIQSTTISSLQLSTYLAIIISFVIYALGIDYQIEKIKRHSEKQYSFALKMGYNESLMTLMDIHLGALIVYLCMIIMGGRMLRSVAINLIIGIVISAIITMLLNRYFLKLLGDLKLKKSKKMIKEENN